ncbi:hypothetical protein Tco_0993776 [Tanacetum coccineum]
MIFMACSGMPGCRLRLNTRALLEASAGIKPVLTPTSASNTLLIPSVYSNAQGRSFDDAKPYFGNSKQTSKARGFPDNNLMKSFAPEKEKASSVAKIKVVCFTYLDLLCCSFTNSNYIGTSVSTQRKRTRQDSQVRSSSCEAGPSKRVHHPTATDRRVSVGRENRQPPTISCAFT